MRVLSLFVATAVLMGVLAAPGLAQNVTVPDVRGMTVAEAGSSLASAGLAIERIERIPQAALQGQFGRTFPNDTVVQQMPAPGTLVSTGMKVSLRIAAAQIAPPAGPAPLPTPAPARVVVPAPRAPADPINYGRAVRVATDNCAPTPRPVDPCAPATGRRGYAGAYLAAYPGAGFGVEWGRIFSTTGLATWSWELNLGWQTLPDGFNANEGGDGGAWVSAGLGVKASLLPNSGHHPTARLGIGWGHADREATADAWHIGNITRDGDYFGGYVGLGWEFDLFNRAITTGPEARFFYGIRPSGSGWGNTLSFLWHFDYNF